MSGIGKISNLESKSLDVTIEGVKSDVKSSVDAHKRVEEGMSFVEPVAVDMKSHRVEVSSEASMAGVLCKQAHDLRLKGDFFKAYQVFRQAAEAGSVEAKFWLGKIQSKNPLRATAIDPKQPVVVKNQVDIKQDVLLKRFVEILNALHQKDPVRYKKDDIDKIKRDLYSPGADKGHCSGLSLYIGELSLFKNPKTGQDRTDEYFQITQKIMNWDGKVFVPPDNFSYTMKDGVREEGFVYREDLTPEEQEQLDFTREVTEFIEIIRFQQQRFSEGYSWGFNDQTLNEHNEALNKAMTMPVHDQLNYGDIYDRPYKMSNEFKVTIEDLPRLINAYMTEETVIQFSLQFGYGGHATSAIYREGKYYYFDPNMTSLEKNYDPRYSACAYESIDDMIKGIQDNLGDRGYAWYIDVRFVSKESSGIVYPTAEEEQSRADFIKLASYIDKMGGDDFYNDLLKEPPVIDIQKTGLENNDMYFFVKRFPGLQFINIDSDRLMEAHFEWGNDDSFYLELAANEGHPRAQLKLMNEYGQVTYIGGQIVNQDYEKALGYVSLLLINPKASDNQQERAKDMLMTIIQNGERYFSQAQKMLADQKKGINYRLLEEDLIVAASTNHPEAQFMLAQFYLGESDLGEVLIEKNPEKAFKYSKMLADNLRADPIKRFDAQFRVADMYEKGRGVIADPYMAIVYYRLIVDSTVETDIFMTTLQDVARKKIKALGA